MGFNTVLYTNYINFSMPIMYNACLLHCMCYFCIRMFRYLCVIWNSA